MKFSFIIGFKKKATSELKSENAENYEVHVKATLPPCSCEVCHQSVVASAVMKLQWIAF